MADEKTMKAYGDLMFREFGEILAEGKVVDLRVGHQGKFGWYGKIWWADQSCYTTPPQRDIDQVFQLLLQKVQERG